jgi:hypothetical protein
MATRARGWQKRGNLSAPLDAQVAEPGLVRVTNLATISSLASGPENTRHDLGDHLLLAQFVEFGGVQREPLLEHLHRVLAEARCWPGR